LQYTRKGQAARRPAARPYDPTQIYFEGCFGWFHPGSTARGVILCSPIGPESDYVHRIWGEFADRLAAAGVSVLRFDYRGTRDSQDNPDAAHPVAGWLESVKAARRWMIEVAGIADVALCGLRFGAAMALSCAEDLKDIERIVLLAPVGSGATYCRELAMLARVAHAEARLPDHVAAGDGGLGLAPEIIADIRGLELATGDAPAVRKALVISRAGAAGERKLTERLKAQGVEVEEQGFDDYATLMISPEFSAYPEATFGRVIDWLRPAEAGVRACVPTQIQTHLKVPSGQETPVSFRDEAPLHGIYGKPRTAAPDRPAALLLNTGAINYAGMNGMWVGVARRLTQAGVATLRFDISGFGDSPARPGQLDPFINMAEALGDVDAAMEWLRERGHSRIILIGFCWGAQLACNIAQTDDRVSAVMLVNPRRLFWDLETPPLEPVVGLKGYMRLAREPARWRALMHGDIPIKKLAKVPLRLVRKAFEDGAARAEGRETQQQIAARKLRSIVQRGVDALVIQGQDDPFLAEFEDYFSVPRTALPALFGMDMQFPHGVDHLFRTAKVRADLADALAERLSQRARVKATG
jgi:pimeloyl-ACP methyl ester carboxylesterase